MSKTEKRYKWVVAKNIRQLNTIDKTYKRHSNEIIAVARNTSLVQLATQVIPDKTLGENPIYAYISTHSTVIGSDELVRKIYTWLQKCQGAGTVDLDILSISSGMKDNKLNAITIVRIYEGKLKFSDLYETLGENRQEEVIEKKEKLIIPKQAIRHYTEEEKRAHAEKIKEQERIYHEESDIPFLNRIEKYERKDLSTFDDSCELIYDLRTKDMQMKTILPYDSFIEIFQSCMRYVSGVEKDTYFSVVRGQRKKEDFWNVLNAYIEKNFILTNRLPNEDFPLLKEKLERALFQLYIVQDLIDDKEITDIKITDPESIRVRVEGKAYMSNIQFIDAEDYVRFVNSIAVKNNVDLKVPSQSFVDNHDENHILRFSVTAPYITSTGLPIIHIRKENRRKLMSDDLIKLGMFNESIRDYLIDRGRDKNSMGIVFAGPPGSGKTVCLNWFLEDAYEQSAEILAIQENDELFAYRKGVMFEHVINNPQKGERPCSLEDLGQMALVAGANVFIIGEAKGGEICSAITLSNSGCRTALTIHSPSSQQTIDKMADLALRGYANSYDQAMRMITSFKTIVYLQDFKIAEISEVVGFDEKACRPVYKKVYQLPEDEKRKGDPLSRMDASIE